MLWVTWQFFRALVLQSVSTMGLFYSYELLSKRPGLNQTAKAELLSGFAEHLFTDPHKSAHDLAFRTNLVAMMAPFCGVLFFQFIAPTFNLILVSKLVGFEEGSLLIQLLANSLLQVYIIDDYLLYFRQQHAQMKLIVNFVLLVCIWNYLTLFLCT